MKHLNFDQVLDEVGSFCKFQKLVIFYFCCLLFLHNENVWINFIGLTPTYECDTQNEKDVFHENTSKTNESMTDKIKYDSCRFTSQNISQVNLTNSSKSLNSTVHRCRKWNYGKEYGETLVTKFNLVCESRWKYDLISSVGTIGILASSLIFGFLSDIFGRKKSLMIGLILSNIGNGILAVAPNYYSVLIAQLIQRLGYGSLYSIICIYVAEIVNTRIRSNAIMFAYIAFNLGVAFMPLVAYLSNGYRMFILIYLLPNSILIISLYFLPESPRWLLSRNEPKKAEVILQKIALVNDKAYEVGECFLEEQKENSLFLTFKSLFGNIVLLKLCFLISVCWITNLTIYYTFFYNVRKLLNFNVFLAVTILGLLQIPVSFLAMWLLNVHFLGRRSLFGLLFFIAAMFSLINMIIQLFGNYELLSSILAFIILQMIQPLNTMLYTYTVELYPTDVRGIGLFTSKTVGYISAIGASYLRNPLLSIWSPLPFMIFCLLSLCSVISIWFLPETKNKDLMLSSEELKNTSRSSKRMDYARIVKL